MPDYFYFNISLFVINGASSDDTVEFLHKIVPVSTLHHGIAAIFELLSGRFDRLLLESDGVLFFLSVKVLHIIKFKTGLPGEEII